MKDQRQITDAIIIGAGPVGLFAVFELGLLGIGSHVVDILDRPGGQCAELYPEKPIYDIPGYPVIMAQALVDNLVKQIEPFAPQFHFSQMAERLDKLENGHWLLKTDTGTLIEAKVIIIAAGGGSFVPKRLPLKEIESYEGHSVFYSVKDKNVFKKKRIIIAGGGDSALDWALELKSIADRVMLVHRREDFRAAPDSVNKIKEFVSKDEMDFYIGQISTIAGGKGQVESVSIRSSNGQSIEVACDALLAFYGLTMKLGPISDFGLNIERNNIPVNTQSFETSRKGIFAIGDINSYPGKLKLILSGFHEAALMAHGAFSYVYPDKKVKFQYSTTSSDLHEKLGVA